MKTLTIVGVVLLTVLALGAAGAVYAQTQNPPVTPAPGYGPGGMMGGNGPQSGFRGGPGHMRGGFGAGRFGPMHQYMTDALAEALGLTSEEFTSRVQAGESPWEIAQSQGTTWDEFVELRTATRDAAIEQALEDGVITEEQAEWMKSHTPGQGPCHQNPETAPDTNTGSSAQG